MKKLGVLILCIIMVTSCCIGSMFIYGKDTEDAKIDTASYETGKMTRLNRENGSFEQPLTGKGNRLEFCIQGNNSAACFSVTVVDATGKTAQYTNKTGNYDLCFSDYRVRRISIDFDGDKSKMSGKCDFSNLKSVVFALVDDPGGDVYIGEAKLVQKTSASDAWDQRRKELSKTDLLTKNSIDEDVVCVNDVDTLRAIRDRLVAENGPLGDDFIRAEGDRFYHKDGSEFIPIGANYLGLNIWEPNFITHFSPAEIEEDFAICKALGFTVVRQVFSGFAKFDSPTDINEADLLKLEVYLELARKYDLRVIVVGGWGYLNDCAGTNNKVSEDRLQRMAMAFEIVANHFKDNPTVFSFTLDNEFTCPLSGDRDMQAQYNEYLSEYHVGRFQDVNDFTNLVTDKWVEMMTAAVRRGSPNHMVSVGFLQWSFPLIRQGMGYAGSDPVTCAQYVDYLSVHYYPLYASNWGSQGTDFHAALQALRAWVNYCKVGKPIILEEFGAPGGGSFWGTYYRQNNQLQWIRAVIDTCAADVAGFVNWPFQDTPGASDISAWCGLIDVEKNPKQAGLEFAELVRTADRTPYEEQVYYIDFYDCTHGLPEAGTFNGTIRGNLNEYLAFLKNKKYDITIVRK